MLIDLIKPETVAIDLHGVIDHAPTLFAPLLRTLIRAGKKVFVVSGPPATQIRKELHDLDMYGHRYYSCIYSVVDHLQIHRKKMWQDENDRWWSSDKDWWNAKGQICRRFGAEVMLDDHIEFKQGFPKGHPTKFILYDNNWKRLKDVSNGSA